MNPKIDIEEAREIVKRVYSAINRENHQERIQEVKYQYLKEIMAILDAYGIGENKIEESIREVLDKVNFPNNSPYYQEEEQEFYHTFNASEEDVIKSYIEKKDKEEFVRRATEQFKEVVGQLSEQLVDEHHRTVGINIKQI